MSGHRRWLPAVVLALLTGCAAIDHGPDCATADWREVGAQDARQGESSQRLADYQARCPSVNADAYRDGYRTGLADYCTYRGGVVAGRRDDPLRGACRDRSGDFRDGYRLGQRLHDLDDALDDVRYQMSETRRALGNQRASQVSYPLAQRLNWLHQQAAYIERRIDDLEAEAEERGSGPLPSPQHPFFY